MRPSAFVKKAQALLNEYKNKAREAETEAESIIEQAKREAEALASESAKSLAESLERRSKLAEEKIARQKLRLSAKFALPPSTWRLPQLNTMGQKASVCPAPV